MELTKVEVLFLHSLNVRIEVELQLPLFVQLLIVVIYVNDPSKSGEYKSDLSKHSLEDVDLYLGQRLGFVVILQLLDVVSSELLEVDDDFFQVA